jgi:hypothetical protein
MKTAFCLLCVLAFSLRGAAANDVAEVKQLEIRLWECWRNHDLKTWAGLTSPDYTWSDGKDHRNYAEVRRMFDMGTLQEYRTGEMQTIIVAPDVIVLSYRASMRGIYMQKPFDSQVAECSVWVKRGRKWQNILLQEIDTSGHTPSPRSS